VKSVVNRKIVGNIDYVGICAVTTVDVGGTTVRRMSETTPNHSLLTSDLSDGAGERKVGNNSVETEVGGRSTSDSVTSSLSAETDGSLASGKIVDVLPSTSPGTHPSLTSDDLTGSEMGIANSKAVKAAKSHWSAARISAEPNDGVKEVDVTRKIQKHKHMSDMEPVSADTSSCAAESFNVALTEDNDRATDDEKLASNVILSGNSGIPDAPGDVTTSEITPEADTTPTKSTSPRLSVLMEEAVTADRVESSVAGLEYVEGASVSVTENGPQLDGSSADVHQMTGVTENSEEDVKSGDQDADTVSSRLRNNRYVQISIQIKKKKKKGQESAEI